MLSSSIATMTISSGTAKVPRARINESCAYLPIPGARQEKIIPALVANATMNINHHIPVEGSLAGNEEGIFISFLLRLKCLNFETLSQFKIMQKEDYTLKTKNIQQLTFHLKTLYLR
jgi:hypothetical protein